MDDTYKLLTSTAISQCQLDPAKSSLIGTIKLDLAG